MKSLIVTALVMALLLQMAWGTRPASQKMQDEITRARKVITPDKRSLDIRQIPPLPNLPNLPNVPGVPGNCDIAALLACAGTCLQDGSCDPNVIANCVLSVCTGVPDTPDSGTEGPVTPDSGTEVPGVPDSGTEAPNSGTEGLVVTKISMIGLPILVLAAMLL